MVSWAKNLLNQPSHDWLDLFFLKTTIIPYRLSVWYDTDYCYLIMLMYIVHDCIQFISIVKIGVCIIKY
jgi:hypothetical protein